ncbi:EAL domain-containing protein [Mycobacterium sp. CVI_P3]|uniref:EAL domain-containing protein n=1 Tax=Mycobacterium pinniadriaticum TaxID=2994102 RepID=A0ABT3S8F3_9MYCO|nr:EAL domain-containing protein [Mycobacterium pinniadriaticum]MCX2929355.1 EAL domain-containing protein [Mycobacterium pinniadriaticum]MCX2935779.1 EAL domain-containing protein [Mycobacterium pinniadriaticum]
MRFEGDGEPLSDVGPEIPVELVRTLLGLLRRRLGLDTAWLSSFRDGIQVFEVLDGEAETLGLSSGDRTNLSDTYCVRVIDGRLPAIIPDTAANQTTRALPMTRALKLGAYVGVPVPSPTGATIGMVCAVSREAKPYLADTDLRVVNQVADLIGTLLESPVKLPDTTAAQCAAMQKVLSQNDFEVVFQPVHDVASGRVIGVEALARFPHAPFRPDAFIARAAQMGLGIALETAILNRVISLVPRLPEDAFVAVNISPAAASVAPWGQLLGDVDPTRIVLELTEHDAVMDYGALDEALDPCRSRGVRIAVDDVGAGFSSFSHVLELGPEFVKIDQSITRNIDVDDARRRLAQAIAELAGQMGATVIAEGVESQGELDVVSAVGITAAQGFYLSRPRPLAHGFRAADGTAAPADLLQTTVDLLGERRFELALAHSPIGMAVVGLDGTFLRTNRALRAMLGYSKWELADLTFQEITHPEDLDADVALLNECLEGRRRSYRIDKRYIAADGHIVWGALTVVIVHAPRDRPRYFVSQIVDVTADRLREADLARQAATDPLTSIANRSAGWKRLEQLDASGAGYGVLFCDIERFKSINDQRGHRAGDRLLVEVACRLREAVRDADMVTRWGGDEFLVITDLVDDPELERMAEKITDDLDNKPVTLSDGTQVSVGLTIGCAAHRPGDERSVDTVLDLADRAMYEKRQHRRGRR